MTETWQRPSPWYEILTAEQRLRAGPRVRCKQQMFRMLDAGEFGNTTERWYSLAAWEGRPSEGTGLWAVRNATGSGGDPRTRLDVPTAELPSLYRDWYGAAGGEISPMVDHRLTARFQLVESARGMDLHAVVGRGDVKWRQAFADPVLCRFYRGAAAKVILEAYLNENSLDDLRLVLERFPGHAVEMTALDWCYGTVPHRNAVVWEVRDY